MERFEVKNVGSEGYISPLDYRPYETPPNALSRAFNVRMVNGGVEAAKGWNNQLTLTNAGGGINALDYNINNTGIWWLYFGDSGIYSADDGGDYDVTRTASGYVGTYPDNIWITDNFNGVVIATNGIDTPQVQEDTNLNKQTPFKDLPGWVANATTQLIIAYKNFVVAMNINDSGVYNNMVWWSDESIDGLIPTSWDYADPESRSGRTTLGTDSGAIIAAKKLRDSIFIYCENGVFRMDWIGGNAVFRFTEVFKNIGVFGPRCVQEFDGKHFVVTNTDIIVHDGQQLSRIGYGKVTREIFSYLNVEQRNVAFTTVHKEADAKEIWLSINSVNDTNHTDLIYAYNWISNTWSLRATPYCRHIQELPQSLGQVGIPVINSYIDVCNQDPDTTNCLVEDTATPDTNFTIDNYAQYNEPYSSVNIVLGDFLIYGIGNNGSYDKFYRMDIGYNYTDTPLTYENTLLEKEDINVSNDETVQMMVSVYPRGNGENPLEFYVGAVDTTESPIRWKGPFIFTPDKDYKISTRIRGRRFAVRIQPTAPVPFRMEGYDIVYTQAGMR